MGLGFSGSGTVVARARAIIEADTSQVGGGLRKGEREFDRSARTIEDRAGRLRGALNFGGAVVAFQQGFMEIDRAAHAVFDRMDQGERIAVQTRATLKSTGDVAGVTSKGMDALATSIEKKSGMDRLAILQGENMLLTFRNVRNEAGKSNDVFNQTVKVAADMAAAFSASGRSMSVTQASIMLGKALNDPEKGLTRLQRVGITFTEAQKQQIKALVDSGHAMDAQKIILASLEQRYRGSAAAAGKTFSGQMSILKQTLEDTAVKYLTRLLPAMQKFATDAVKEITVIAKAKETHKLFHDALEVVRTAYVGLKSIVSEFIDLMHNRLFRILTLATAAIWILNAAVEANPFMALATAAILAVGLIVQHWKTITDFFSKLWTDIKDTGNAAWNALKDVAKSAVYGILQYATLAIRGILEVASKIPFIGGAAKRALNSINSYLDTWKPDFSNVVDAFSNGGTAAGDSFANSAADAIAQTGKLAALKARQQGSAPTTVKHKGKGVTYTPHTTSDFSTTAVKSQTAAQKAQSAYQAMLQVPADIAIAEANARGTKTISDDIAAFRAEQAWLFRLIHSGKVHKADLAGLINQYYDLRDQIAQMVADARKKQQKKIDALTKARLGEPASIAIAEAKALGTKSLADDIAAYTEEENWLIRRIKSGEVHGQKLADLYKRKAEVQAKIDADRKKANQAAETAAQKAARDELAYLNTRSTFFDQYAGNVFRPDAGSVSSTTTSPTGGGTTVVVNQHFNSPTTDRHREARLAKFATQAAFD